MTEPTAAPLPTCAHEWRETRSATDPYRDEECRFCGVAKAEAYEETHHTEKHTVAPLRKCQSCGVVLGHCGPSCAPAGDPLPERLANWLHSAIEASAYYGGTTITVPIDIAREAAAAIAVAQVPENTCDLKTRELTDEELMAILNEHAPSQGEPFEWIPFARDVIRAATGMARWLPSNETLREQIKNDPDDDPSAGDFECTR